MKNRLTSHREYLSAEYPLALTFPNNLAPIVPAATRDQASDPRDRRMMARFRDNAARRHEAAS